MPQPPVHPTPPRRGLPLAPKAGKPSLGLALAKVLGVNMAHVGMPTMAGQMTEDCLDDYARAGGDPGAHANLLGGAAAVGSALPMLLALLGARGMRAPSDGGNAEFLKSLDRTPVGRNGPGLPPIDYMRPTK